MPLPGRTASGRLGHGNTVARVGKPKLRKPNNPIGEVIDGLLTAKRWSSRDLENATRADGQPGYVSHQYISNILRGRISPGDRVLSRLLAPFGYRAVTEIRLEPLSMEAEEGWGDG